LSAVDLDRLADLVVGFGANVQPGQIVAISSEHGKEEFTRALAASAYRAGAKFVDASYFDMHIKRARLLHGREEDLEFVPSWYGERLLELGRQRCARIALTGPAEPHLFDDVDPVRAGLDQLPHLEQGGEVVNQRTTNWCGVPCPTPGWAKLVYPDLDEAAALDLLWERILHVMRMDTPDPIAAWTERMDALLRSAAALTERRFDSLRFRGEGTDLTIGLMPSSRWLAAQFETVDGLVHRPNLPSEEVFTTPDPERTEGVVRSTKPLVLGGSIINGLAVEFSGGRVTRIDADDNAEVLRAYADRDDGACRLGEVALVDGEGRIGPLDTVFFDTLLDENAASHIALGSAYTFAVDEEADAARANRSSIHVDFMIGSDRMEVDATTREGEVVPVLRSGRWQI
jgi:aminopeptidase